MGIEVSKVANAKCTVCRVSCCDSQAHRVRAPHKARCCAVCSRWYCGTHKNTHMERRRKSAGKNQSYYIYKCEGCVGIPRRSHAVRS